MMTTVAALFDTLPIALGYGEGAQARQQRRYSAGARGVVGCTIDAGSRGADWLTISKGFAVDYGTTDVLKAAMREYGLSEDSPGSGRGPPDLEPQARTELAIRSKPCKRASRSPVVNPRPCLERMALTFSAARELGLFASMTVSFYRGFGLGT